MELSCAPRAEQHAALSHSMDWLLAKVISNLHGDAKKCAMYTRDNDCSLKCKPFGHVASPLAPECRPCLQRM